MEEDGISSFIVRAIAFVIFIFMLIAVGIAFAAPMLEWRQDGVRVVIYSEECALKESVTNLPKRATWEEGGKTFEGCAGLSPRGTVLFYFLDKTVVDIPVRHFAPVVSA